MQFVILFLLGNATFSHGQTEKKNDTLVDWSYDFIFEKFDKSTNLEEALQFSNAYLRKAKIEKDTFKIANGYTLVSSNYVNDPLHEDLNLAILYCDSIIALTSPNFDKKFPGWAYLYKGLIQFHIGEYENALNNYSNSYKLALSHQNEIHLFRINENIAQLKLFWGNAEDAINLYYNQLELLKKNNELGTDYNKLNLYLNLSNSYLIKNEIDSAQIIHQRTFAKYFKKIQKRNFYTLFLHQSGEILFYKKQYEQATDSLFKSLESDKSKLKSDNTYNILGQIALKSQDTAKAVEFFNKADEIISITKDITPETKVIHSFLKDYYLAKGDRKNYKIYAEKLNKTDSALTENYKLVNRKLIEDFEIPKLLIEKNDAFGTVEEKETPWIFKNRTLFIFATTILIGAFVYIKRKQYLERKKLDPLKGMNPDLVRRLMKQLDNFEKKKTFSNKKYNLKTISEKFQTNSSYLSKVINAKKGKNVSSYLSDLRINHCLKELNSNKIYQNYDVKSLAIEFGFNNAESFTKAFSSRTGSTPAAYIQQLKS